LLIASGRDERPAEQPDADRSKASNETAPAVHPTPSEAGPESAVVAQPSVQPSDPPSDVRRALPPGVQPSNRALDAPARDRAQTAATRHAVRHGELPTVSQLMNLAAVSRGTAGEALKAL